MHLVKVPVSAASCREGPTWRAPALPSTAFALRHVTIPLRINRCRQPGRGAARRPSFLPAPSLRWSASAKPPGRPRPDSPGGPSPPTVGPAQSVHCGVNLLTGTTLCRGMNQIFLTLARGFLALRADAKPPPPSQPACPAAGLSSLAGGPPAASRAQQTRDEVRSSAPPACSPSAPHGLCPDLVCKPETRARTGRGEGLRPAHRGVSTADHAWVHKGSPP